VLVLKLEKKLQKAQKAAVGGVVDWDAKLKEQQDLQVQLEKEIKHLEKQN
jgi:hypothetical protein